ncbi:MAG: hypothetical protein JSU62_00370, partial [Gammaproteobacteria bacterium]
MKADLSRDTFRKQKHYSSVRIQQGRVQVDADWNEELDILGHRTRTETVDVIGHCGVPMAAGGVHVVAAVTDLSAEEQARDENQGAAPLAGGGDFYISGGRLYADGSLCENEQIVPYSAQPHLPSPPLANSAGIYLAYLDVWQRHVTALEDDEIREKALGGVDTATRTQTLWQVRCLQVGNPGDAIACLTPLAAYDDAIAAPSGRLAAQVQPGGSSTDPCIVPSSAGYRRLENQLYRVEVHDGGNLGNATFKWSRENGTVVAHWESQNVDQITVSSTGRDTTLGFNTGDWVELIDDERELLGLPGTLVRLLEVSDNVLTLETATATDTTSLADFQTHPRVRRWDGAGLLQPGNSDWLDLEDGVQISVSNGSYRSGDYWLIPARTNTGGVEWPIDESTGNPALRSPAGIDHSYCRLAILTHDGSGWTAVEDCRPPFPALTQFKQLFYVSGDGQEALPNAELDRPLQVGVSNGQHPVAGARVSFTRIDGDGTLLPGSGTEESGTATERIVITGSDGIAECRWQLGAATGPRTHRVEARLLDVIDNPRHLPIRFTASLSLAAHVYYDGNVCPPLAAADTVQDAIDTLAHQATITAWAGNGQEAIPGTPLTNPLQVVVSNACGPIANATVNFTPEANGRAASSLAGLAGATPGDTLSVTTDADGMAEAYWQLDPDLALTCQYLLAELIDAGGVAIRHPARFYFNGCHTQDRTCLQFLDELRSNGIVREPPDGPLGLAVRADPLGGNSISYTAAIAYVNGCRRLVEAGAMNISGDGRHQLVVDDAGQLLINNAATANNAALVANIYLLEGVIMRIVDLRLDVTHLDDRVETNTREIATRRQDRKRFIPLLVRTIADVHYEDGRNLLLSAEAGADLTLDGRDPWMTARDTNNLIRIPHDARRNSDLESIPLPIDIPARLIEYDGLGGLFLTPSASDADNPLAIYHMRISTRQVRTIDLSFIAPGLGVPDESIGPPTAIGIDYHFVWLSIPIAEAPEYSLLLVLNLRDLSIELLTIFYRTSAFCFDGRTMWLEIRIATGAVTTMLYGFDVGSGEIDVGGVVPLQGTVDDVVFDGAYLWVVSGSTAFRRIDVRTLETTIVEDREFSGARLICDGSNILVVESD